MLLPKKVGSFTLMRKLDADGMTESYVGILDDPAGQQVVARRVLPAVARDPDRLAQVRARVGDLRPARHPSLVPILDLVEAEGELYTFEEWTEGVELRALIAHCAATGTTVPHNVYLNLATQVCNALEALHSRRGAASGSENVLHLALSPSAMWVTSEGRLTVGRYGLARSPTAIATQATGSIAPRVEYLAPEQTHQDQPLTPASDIFALGAILYELLTLRPMFKADSHLQTIHRVRRAEVTTQLLEVKEILPGLDKVLFRALSLNPRHRYQRAFVLREDLRGLMAGYSFADIDEITRAFLAPIFKTGADGLADPVVDAVDPPPDPGPPSELPAVDRDLAPPPLPLEEQRTPPPPQVQAPLAAPPVTQPEVAVETAVEPVVEPVVDRQRTPTVWMPVAGGAAALSLVALVCAGVGGASAFGLLASSSDEAGIALLEEAALDRPAPPPMRAASSLAGGLGPPAPPPPTNALGQVSSLQRSGPEEHVRAPAPKREGASASRRHPRERASAAERAVTASELDAWSVDAFDGALDPDAKGRLLAVSADDPSFTRARTLLFLDAKARGDTRSRDRHLAAMMAVPENQYNPVLLVEEAQIAAERRDWERALDRATLAERYWARLPSDLVFTRKALIYEIQAAAHTSLFYASHGDDTDRLSLAIRGWERYLRHVGTKDRPDLVARADDNLQRLHAIERRLQ